jgi:hypothetical protein
MSQYPSPYSTPDPNFGGYGYGYDPLTVHLTPARRAGLLSILLGVLLLFCGGGCLGMGWFINSDQVPPEARAQLEQQEAEIRQATGMGLAQVATIMGAVMMVPALLMIVLGVMVRRGGLGSVVSLMVVTILMILVLGLQLIGALLGGGTRDPGTMLLGACLFVVPLAMLGLLLYFLINAARASGMIRMIREQPPGQAGQYQQDPHMHPYAGPGIFPPPPPPPPGGSPPPTADPFDPRRRDDLR